MKILFRISILAVLISVVASPCFADWGIERVSRERAKALNMVIRSKAAGPDTVRVELEFKTDGALKRFGHVDLRIGEGEKSLVTATLQEKRPGPGRVVVSFAADRAHLDKIALWVMVPESLGGSIYEVRAKDFVEPEKVPPNRPSQ